MPIKNCLSWYKRVRLYRVYILVSYIHACIVYTHLYRILTFVSYIHTYIAYRNSSFFGATWSLPIVNWFSYKIFATDSLSRLFKSNGIYIHTYMYMNMYMYTHILYIWAFSSICAIETEVREGRTIFVRFMRNIERSIGKGVIPS